MSGPGTTRAASAVMAMTALVLSACGAHAAQSQVASTTSATSAPAVSPAPSTTTALPPPALSPATFASYTVRVPAGWTATSDVGDLGARAIWSNPADPRYSITITNGPGANYWNPEKGRWRGDLPGFPEDDANRVTPKYLQYPPMVVDDVATTRALMVNRNASQWVELTVAFPIGWQATADDLSARFADCVTGRGAC